MITTGIVSAARAAIVAALTGAVSLGLATGTAQATPGAPVPSKGGTLYGDPAAAARFWRYQQLDDSCVEMAVADVVGELTGNEPSEQAVVEVAESTRSTVHRGPIYDKPGTRGAGTGTSFGDEPALLAHYGIHAVTTVGAGMPALEQDLAQGRKVIAGVNSEVIWGHPVEDTNRDGQPAANHSVVVTGIDTKAGIVHLNDSGSEQGRDEQVPIDVFLRSWDGDNDQLTVTG